MVANLCTLLSKPLKGLKKISLLLSLFDSPDSCMK